MANTTLIRALETVKQGLSKAEGAPTQDFCIVMADRFDPQPIQSITISPGNPPPVQEDEDQELPPEKQEARDDLVAAAAVFQRVLGKRNVSIRKKPKIPLPDIRRFDGSVSVYRQGSSEDRAVSDEFSRLFAQLDASRAAGEETVLVLTAPHGLSIRDLFPMNGEAITPGLVSDIVDASEKAGDRFKKPDEIGKPHSADIKYAAKQKGGISAVVNVGDKAWAERFAKNDRGVLFADYGVIDEVRMAPTSNSIEFIFSSKTKEVPKHTMQARLEGAISALRTWKEHDGVFISGAFTDEFIPAQLTYLLDSIMPKLDGVSGRSLQFKMVRADDGTTSLHILPAEQEGKQLDSAAIERFIAEQIGGRVQRGRNPAG